MSTSATAPQGGTVPVVSGGQTTQLAAISWPNGDGTVSERLYFQAADGTLNELCSSGSGTWTTGVFSAYTNPNTNLAATWWFDQAQAIHIRVYYTTSSGIQEHCFDGSWTEGATLNTSQTPGSGLAAISGMTSGGSIGISVYYQTYEQGQESTLLEQYYQASSGWAERPVAY